MDPPLRHFWQGLFRDHEGDPGFYSLNQRLSQRGMLLAGCFGLAATVSYVLVHVWMGGRPLSWTYDEAFPLQSVVLWDKSLIISLSLVAVVISRLKLSLIVSRLAMAIFIVGVCAAILADDIANQSVDFSSGFMTLVLLAGVNVVPFRPLQTFGIGLACLGLLYVGIVMAPERAGFEPSVISFSQLIYFGLVVITLTGLSALIYHYRFEQYRGLKRVEALNRELADRSEVLEVQRRKTEEQADKLIAMEALKTRLFSNVSHEFRTPLTLILGPIQDALDERLGPLDGRLRASLLMMRRNCYSLLRLVDELLDVARLEANQMPLERHAHDLVDFLRRTVDEFRPLAERRRVALTYRSNVDMLSLDFDAMKMEKVLNNLLSNAFKFTPAQGAIDLSLELSDRVSIRVRDSGPGIPSSELPYIFDRFHQVRNSHHSSTAGSGLGLAITKDLVELHGGTITAQNSSGSGLEIVISLPYQQPEGPVESVSLGGLDDVAEAEGIDDVVWPGQCAPDAPLILVVDDSDDIRAYLKSHLSSRYRIVEAADGRAALDAVAKRVPDLVISDVMMPGMDGYDLTTTLKSTSATRHVPVIILTALTTDAEKLLGLHAHADDYIVKPFSSAELLARVENLIEIRRLLAAPFARMRVDATSSDIPSAEEVFLQNVRSVIESEMSNSHFGVDWLADEVGISPRQLQRRLHAGIRLSAAGLIRMMRLQRAEQLLSSRAATVSEISHMVGFRDQAYFSRLFRQTFGQTPSDYMVCSRRDGDSAIDVDRCGLSLGDCTALPTTMTVERASTETIAGPVSG